MKLYNKSQLKASLFLMLLSFVVFLIKMYPLRGTNPRTTASLAYGRQRTTGNGFTPVFIELEGNFKGSGVYNSLELISSSPSPLPQGERVRVRGISLGKIMEIVGINEKNLGLRKEDSSIIISNGMKLILQPSSPRILVDKMSAEKHVLFSIAMDLREVDFEDLTAIPGIGTKRALQILRLREEGEIKTISDLKKIRGIGEKTYKSIRKYLQ